MIGTHLKTPTQHWQARGRVTVHFEPAYQMVDGVTCCGIDLNESKQTYDETRAKVTCRPCLTAIKANEDAVKRDNRAQQGLVDRML